MIKDAFRFSWNTFKKNWGFLIGINIFSMIFMFLPSLVMLFFVHPEQVTVHPHHTETILQAPPAVMAITAILRVVFVFIASMGLLKISLIFASEKRPRFSDFFSPLPFIGSYFVGNVLFSITLVVGLLLLVFPFFIWLPQFFLFSYFIIDKGLGPIKALEASSEATEGKRLALLGFIVLVLLLNIVGFLALGVGALITQPVTGIAQARIYKQLS